jgi:hypothetical protein
MKAATCDPRTILEMVKDASALAGEPVSVTFFRDEEDGSFFIKMETRKPRGLSSSTLFPERLFASSIGLNIFQDALRDTAMGIAREKERERQYQKQCH